MGDKTIHTTQQKFTDLYAYFLADTVEINL